MTDIIVPDGIGVLCGGQILDLSNYKDSSSERASNHLAGKVFTSFMIFYPKLCRYPIRERIPGVESLYLMLDRRQLRK